MHTLLTLDALYFHTHLHACTPTQQLHITRLSPVLAQQRLAGIRTNPLHSSSTEPLLEFQVDKECTVLVCVHLHALPTLTTTSSSRKSVYDSRARSGSTAAVGPYTSYASSSGGGNYKSATRRSFTKELSSSMPDAAEAAAVPVWLHAQEFTALPGAIECATSDGARHLFRVWAHSAVPGGSITLGGNGSSDLQYFVLACPTLPTAATATTAVGATERATLSGLGGGSQSRGLTREPTRRRPSKRRHSTVELAILEQRRQRAQQQQQSRKYSHNLLLFAHNNMLYSVIVVSARSLILMQVI
eukprot:12604-Heterococcus_DN1.PRE.3